MTSPATPTRPEHRAKVFRFNCPTATRHGSWSYTHLINGVRNVPIGGIRLYRNQQDALTAARLYLYAVHVFGVEKMAEMHQRLDREWRHLRGGRRD